MASLTPTISIAPAAGQNVVILGAATSVAPATAGAPAVMIDPVAAAASRQLDQSARNALSQMLPAVQGSGPTMMPSQLNRPPAGGALHPHERLLTTLLTQHKQRYGNLPTPVELAGLMSRTHVADPATVVMEFGNLSSQVGTRAPAEAAIAPVSNALAGGLNLPATDIAQPTPELTTSMPSVPAVTPGAATGGAGTAAELETGRRDDDGQADVEDRNDDDDEVTEAPELEIEGEGPPPPGLPEVGAEPAAEADGGGPDAGEPATTGADPVDPSTLPPPGAQGRSPQENADVVASVAREYDIDPALAVAAMLAASGGDNRADAGGRAGLFGLDEEATGAAGLTGEDPYDPFLNARVAMGILSPALDERVDEPDLDVAADVLELDVAAIGANLPQAAALAAASPAGPATAS